MELLGFATEMPKADGLAHAIDREVWAVEALMSGHKEKIIMQITIELPDDIANQLQPVNVSRRVLELIAADHYRQGRIGAAEVRQILNFSSRWETYKFLKREKAYLPYTEDDLEQDVQAIRNLLATE